MHKDSYSDNLRATTNLKTLDAIHAATALAQGCSMFLTIDRRFPRDRQFTRYAYQ